MFSLRAHLMVVVHPPDARWSRDTRRTTRPDLHLHASKGGKGGKDQERPECARLTSREAARSNLVNTSLPAEPGAVGCPRETRSNLTDQTSGTLLKADLTDPSRSCLPGGRSNAVTYGLMSTIGIPSARSTSANRSIRWIPANAIVTELPEHLRTSA